MSTGLSLDATPAEQAAAAVPIKRRKVKPQPSVPDVRPLPPHAMEDDAPAIQVRTMADLARDFPHLRMDSTCEQAATKLTAANEMLAPSGGTAKRARDPLDPRTIAAAASAAAAADLSPHKKDLDQVQSQSLHFSASQSDPLEFTLMQRARANLAMPERRIADVLHTHKDASSILRRATGPRLPVYTAKHESNLLRFHAGTFDLPNIGKRTFPPCCYGIHCRGRVPREIPGLTESVTLTRAMSPDELLALLKDNTQPIGQMPCILCGRFTLTHAVLLQRHGLRPSLPPLQVEQPDSVLQLWRNMDNEPEGYFRRYIFHAMADEVAIEPIANYHPSLLHANFDPKLQTWTVHQDQMVWRPAALLPRDVVGESVQSF